MLPNPRRLMASLMIAAGLSACGQAGPLVLPEDAAPRPIPSPTPSPGPDDSTAGSVAPVTDTQP